MVGKRPGQVRTITPGGRVPQRVESLEGTRTRPSVQGIKQSENLIQDDPYSFPQLDLGSYGHVPESFPDLLISLHAHLLLCILNLVSFRASFLYVGRSPNTIAPKRDMGSSCVSGK